MEDNTQVFRTDDPRGGAKPLTKGESTILNISVRGVIALLLSIGMIAAVAMVLMFPSVADQDRTFILGAFAGAVSQALTHYFSQKSTEGQTPK